MSLPSIIFFCLLIVCCVVIAYQDFKTRSVSLWVLILFVAVCAASVVYFRDAVTLIYNVIGITAYFGLIWLGLKLYLYVKHKRNVKLLNEQFGAGDIWVILGLGATFNLIGNILFFCAAFTITLLIALIYSQVKNKSPQTMPVPLAGILVFLYLSAIAILILTGPVLMIDCSFEL